MPRSFRVEVITRERMVLDREVISLIAPGREGYLGVMAGHAPLITELTVGKLMLRDPGNEVEELSVGGGFMEVMPERTVVLAESAEFSREIDVERARHAAERARQRLLGESGDQTVDLERARAALMRALNRLKIA